MTDDYRKKIELVRCVVKSVDSGDIHEAEQGAKDLLDAGFEMNQHLGVTGDHMTPAQVVEWYAGQLIAIVDARAWQLVNSWLNCVDKFAPEPKESGS